MNTTTKTKILVLVTIFIDVIGIGIIIPIMPFYVRSFGVSDTIITLLFAVYAFFSFFSAPYLGSLSDRIGRRKILIISIASSAIGWFMFAKASSILFLFIGRIIDGLAAGNITTAQSTLADIARDDKERILNMGLFGVLFGIGLIIGPIVGGLLGSFGTSIPFLFVGILATTNAVLAYFFLPETHITRNTNKKILFSPFTPIIDGFRDKEIRGLFFVWFLFCIGIAIQQSTFSLYASSVWNYSERALGFIYGGLGIIIVFNQVILLRHFWLNYFNEKTLTRCMLILYGFGILFTAAPFKIVFFLGIILATFGQGNLRTVFSSLIASFKPEKRGEYLGISSSLMSLSMIIGPLIVTMIYVRHPALPFVIAAICAFIGFGVMRHSRV